MGPESNEMEEAKTAGLARQRLLEEGTVKVLEA
jgi:hypothetical protein